MVGIARTARRNSFKLKGFLYGNLFFWLECGLTVDHVRPVVCHVHKLVCRARLAVRRVRPIVCLVQPLIAKHFVESCPYMLVKYFFSRFPFPQSYSQEKT